MSAVDFDCIVDQYKTSIVDEYEKRTAQSEARKSASSSTNGCANIPVGYMFAQTKLIDYYTGIKCGLWKIQKQQNFVKYIAVWY